MKQLFKYLRTFNMLGLYLVILTVVVLLDTQQLANSAVTYNIKARPTVLRSVRSLNSSPIQSSNAYNPHSILKLNSNNDLTLSLEEYKERSIDGEQAEVKPNVIHIPSVSKSSSPRNKIMKHSDELNAFDEFVDLLTTSTRTVCHPESLHSPDKYSCLILTNRCISLTIRSRKSTRRCTRHLEKGYDIQPAIEKRINEKELKSDARRVAMMQRENNKSMYTDVRGLGKEVAMTVKMNHEKVKKTRYRDISTTDQNKNNTRIESKENNSDGRHDMMEETADKGEEQTKGMMKNVSNKHQLINNYKSSPYSITLKVDTYTTFQKEVKELLLFPRHTPVHSPPQTLKLTIILDLAGLNSLHKYEIISKFLKVMRRDLISRGYQLVRSSADATHLLPLLLQEHLHPPFPILTLWRYVR
ncbi:hypothetical protein Pmani_037069 [Petrolisthes manimaculis]|uniref:Uncharacterized protein n=1 Tax=Petrolisthes manimaculis TaxID=1843537 RepID=A0AAE1NIY0_9EUCA|nr:hypothetical protein Pmani_037069 [Petrolisthes manimaculis]